MDFLKNVAVATASLICAGLILKGVEKAAGALVTAIEKKQAKPVEVKPAPEAV